MTKTNSNTKQDFILRYRAALKSKLTREQFAELLNVKADSIIRRRLSILRETGLNLSLLSSNPSLELSQDDVKKYNEALDLLSEKTEKTHIENNKNVYVITSAQNATPIHEGFFACLLNYCSARDAQLLIIPNRYKNPTSVWTQNNDGDEWWDSKISPFMCNDDIRLAKSLRVMGNIKIQPTAERPLSGFDSYTGQDSAIFGHPKVQLKTIATPSKMFPKLLTSTGSVTISNYTDSKAGWKGDFHHSISAVVVEVENDGTFHIRHIHGDSTTGEFYDLNKYYTSVTVENVESISALVTGDTHAEFVDENVLNGTYIGDDSIVGFLKPKYIVFHDLLDFYSQNHHHRNNDLIKVGKHRHGWGNVEEGLQMAADFIDYVSRPESTNVLVKSNHDEAFDRWLREAEPKDDPENAQFYHYMKWHQYKNLKKNNTGFESIDPFEFWCKNPENGKGLTNMKNTIFLKRGQSFPINGIEVSFHGDMGINGAKGNANSFARIGSKSVIGHSHSPEIFEGCYQVGLSAKLDLEYQRGAPSSWLHTHCLIYPDGKRTLINIINGKWKI